MGDDFGYGLLRSGRRPWRRRARGQRSHAAYYREHFAQWSFWRSLGTADQAALAASATEATFPPGTVLCREGDETSDVFVIESGWVRVSIQIGDREQIIAVRGPGDVVGERAVLTMDPRSATVTTLNEVRAWVVRARRFAEFLEDHPAARESIKHLNEERDAEDRRRWGAPEAAATDRHLAGLILRLARRTGWDDRDPSAVLELPMSATELTSWADATPSAVGRYLRSWRRRGIVLNDSGAHVLVIALARLSLFYSQASQPVWTSPYGRPVWQAFTDGVGGTLDLFGETRTRRAGSAFLAALAEAAHARCLDLGLRPDEGNGAREGSSQ